MLFFIIASGVFCGIGALYVLLKNPALALVLLVFLTLGVVTFLAPPVGVALWGLLFLVGVVSRLCH
jgi:hypothetical protein